MTPLITLPNGNAVRPEFVQQINFLPKLDDHPDRVLVLIRGGIIQLINCTSPEEAQRLRDAIIAQVNEAKMEGGPS